MKTLIEPARQADGLARAVIGAAIEVHRQSCFQTPPFVLSAGGASERSPRRQPWEKVAFVISPGRDERTGAFLRRFFLPPLTGLVFVGCLNPRLSPWAILFRRSAAVIFYLKATGLQLGLLINFNVSILKSGIQRVVYTNNQTAMTPGAAR